MFGTRFDVKPVIIRTPRSLREEKRRCRRGEQRGQKAWGSSSQRSSIRRAGNGRATFAKSHTNAVARPFLRRRRRRPCRRPAAASPHRPEQRSSRTTPLLRRFFGDGQDRLDLFIFSMHIFKYAKHKYFARKITFVESTPFLLRTSQRRWKQKKEAFAAHRKRARSRWRSCSAVAARPPHPSTSPMPRRARR